MILDLEQSGGSIGWAIVQPEAMAQITQDLIEFYKSLRFESKDFTEQNNIDWKKDSSPKEEGVDVGQPSKVRAEQQDVNNELFCGLKDKGKIKMESEAEGIQTPKVAPIFSTESGKEKLWIEMEVFWMDSKTDDCYQLEENGKEGNLKSLNSQYGLINDIWKEGSAEIYYPHLQILKIMIDGHGFASWKGIFIGATADARRK